MLEDTTAHRQRLAGLLFPPRDPDADAPPDSPTMPEPTGDAARDLLARLFPAPEAPPGG